VVKAQVLPSLLTAQLSAAMKRQKEERGAEVGIEEPEI
jgi:hypothetical protein